MIDILGGVYLEKCISPEWSHLYGSGGRSAAALCELSGSVALHTYIGRNFANDFRAIAKTFGFDLHETESEHNISFHYFHGLSVPQIYPRSYQTLKSKLLSLKSENILRFGFIEGDAKVDGKMVVYDPQSPDNPRRFYENGSCAEHLALILNVHEGQLLAGASDPLEIVSKLLKDHGADVVVLKMGSAGTLVHTSNKQRLLPCLKTKFVWPIGSGDIFAAVFAHYWAEKRFDALEASVFASKATAYYCRWRSLPIPLDFEKSISNHIEPLNMDGKLSKAIDKQVYLAGPFFTISQRWLIEEIRKALLDQGLKVFSPLHEVGHGEAQDVAISDIEGIEKSNIVFAVLDGFDPGTIFEVGFAMAKGLPVIGLVQNEKAEDLKMLEGTRNVSMKMRHTR